LAYRYPLAITGGPDGNVWFLAHGGTVGKITPDGVITNYSAPSSSDFPDRGITAGPDGNVWFTTDTGNLDRITPDGTITEIPIPEQYADGRGIVTGPDGNLWFTDTTPNHIWQHNPTCARDGAGFGKPINPSPSDPTPVAYPIYIVYNPVCAPGGAGADKPMNPSPSDPPPGSPVDTAPQRPEQGASSSRSDAAQARIVFDDNAPVDTRLVFYTLGDKPAPVGLDPGLSSDGRGSTILRIPQSEIESLPPFWNVGLDRHFTDAPHLTSAEPIDAVFGGADCGNPALAEIELQQPRLAEWPAQPFHGTDELDGRS
jgi:hypothetical protein